MRRVVVALVALVGVSHGEAGWNQWTSMGPGGNPVPVAIDPVTPATIYSATPNVAGVFKSTDGGAHWSASSVGLTAPFVTALAVDPQTPTTVYAGAIGTDVCSRPEARTWSSDTPESPHPSAMNKVCPYSLRLVVDPNPCDCL